MSSRIRTDKIIAHVTGLGPSTWPVRRLAEVPGAGCLETAFWEITPGEGRNLATVSGQKCVRGRAKERARCPIGVQRPPSAPHDARLAAAPRPHCVRRLLARRFGGAAAPTSKGIVSHGNWRLRHPVKCERTD